MLLLGEVFLSVCYNEMTTFCFSLFLGHSDMVWSAAYSRTEQDLFVSVSQVCWKFELYFPLSFPYTLICQSKNPN